MGKKVKKKARNVHKEKRVVSITVPQQSIPIIKTLDDDISVVKERKVCPHLDKGIDLVKVSSKFGSAGPRKCEDCREDVVDRRTGKGKGKHGKKKGGGSVDSKPDSKAIWICLECGHFSCGGAGFPTTPQSHAVRHARQNRHPLAIQFENPHLRWCFPCSTLIPVENTEENGEPKDVLFDIMKVIKAWPPEGASVDVEDVWFGSGSITSEIKSENTVSSSLHTRHGYVARGLVNLGNSCFFNSIMQNLLGMDKLRDYFLKLDGSVGPLTVSLKKLFIETSSEDGLGSIINPKSFFGCVCAKAPQFRGFQQHDSHELLRCLLDGLCIEESCARKQTEFSEEDGTSTNPAPTFVDVIFGGQLSSTVSCLECGHSSIVYEPFLDLSLPVRTKRPPSKKAPLVSRAKKPKMPPKRSGRIRSRINKVADPLPAQNVINPASGGKSSCHVQSSAPAAEKMVASSGDSTALESIDQSIVGDNKGSASQNLSATEESENMLFFENVLEKTAVSSEDSTWLDYCEPGTISNDHDLASQINDISVTQDIGDKDAVQNDVFLQNTMESTRLVPPLSMEEKASLSSNLTWLDFLEPRKLSDKHDMSSQINDTFVIQDSGNKDAVQNDAFLSHSSESGSQICSKESNLKMDILGNSWEDQPSLQVHSSEILLLPYKEETSTISEVLRGEGEVMLSSIGCEQDSLDFDGFVDLFNEPETAAGPSVKPLSSDNTSGATEVAETGFIFGNSSGSDVDEVDNTDSPVSVESCLAYFTKPELLSKIEHSWHCDHCSKALREQRMRSRKKLQKPTSMISVNGGEDGTANAPLGLGKDCPFPTVARNLNNGSIKEDALRSSYERLVSHDGKIDGNQNCFLKTNLRDEPNPVASQLEEGKVKLNVALPRLSESPSWSKACIQESFSCEASDSFIVNEPGSSGCNTGEVQQRESQFLAGGHESEGSENEEVDSESVKVKRDATKRILITKAPPILTIHLKRFSQDARGRISKLNGHVDFRDTVDLRPYLDPRCTERDKCIYRLVGVVEHLGAMRGGHYVAYVRGGAKSSIGIGEAEKENGAFVWYHASDAYVREAPLEEVLSCEAYLLFYEQI